MIRNYTKKTIKHIYKDTKVDFISIYAICCHSDN